MNTPAVLLYMAAQQPPDVPALWPYIVAVGGLVSAVVFLFGVIMKINDNQKKEIHVVHEEHRLADEARSIRISAEHKAKDQALLDVSLRSIQVIERVANAINSMGGQQETLTVRETTDPKLLTPPDEL